MSARELEAEAMSLIGPTSLTSSSPSSDTKKNDDTLLSNPLLSGKEEFSLRIKCTSPGIDPPSSGGDFYEVCVRMSDTVQSLKNDVRSSIGQSARGRYLRLIASGRLLAPDTAKLSTFKLKDEDYVHAVVAAAGVRGGQQAAMARGQNSGDTTNNNRRLRNIGIGPTGLILPSASEWDESDDDDVEAGNERRGFDRLRSTGLTRDEIAAIRLYFSRSVDRFAEDRRNNSSSSDNDNSDSDNDGGGGTSGGTSSSPTPESTAADDTDNQSMDEEDRSRQRRLRLEEEWMDAQGPTSEFRLNLSANNPWLNRRLLLSGVGDDDGTGAFATRPVNMVGTDRDFMWGFFLGFFVGFIMLFWVWMPTVPHKQKLGILTGISFQLALNMLKSTGTHGGELDSEGG